MTASLQVGFYFFLFQGCLEVGSRSSSIAHLFFLTWGNDWQIMGQLKPDMRQRSLNNWETYRPSRINHHPMFVFTLQPIHGGSPRSMDIISVSSLWILCLLVMWLWVCPHKIAQLSEAGRRDTRYCLVNQWNSVEIVEWHRKCLCIVSWNLKTGAPRWVNICDGNAFSPIIPAVALVSVLPYSRGIGKALQPSL